MKGNTRWWSTEILLSIVAGGHPELIFKGLVKHGFTVKPTAEHDGIDALIPQFIVNEPHPGFLDPVMTDHLEEILVEFLVDDIG